MVTQYRVVVFPQTRFGANQTCVVILKRNSTALPGRLTEGLEHESVQRASAGGTPAKNIRLDAVDGLTCREGGKMSAWQLALICADFIAKGPHLGQFHRDGAHDQQHPYYDHQQNH